MKRTVVLRKINLPGVFIRTAVPLVVVGVAIGILLGIFLTLADKGAAGGWLVVLQSAASLGLWGLAVSMVITVLTAVYNIIIHLTGGIRLSADDKVKK